MTMPDRVPGSRALAATQVHRAQGDEPDAGAEEITSMRATFPGWNVWRSDEGG
jgi:hypothetical protein